jgi:hypothetical protein
VPVEQASSVAASASKPGSAYVRTHSAYGPAASASSDCPRWAYSRMHGAIAAHVSPTSPSDAVASRKSV